MLELLLPRTDGGVFVQMAIVVVVGAAAVRVTWDRREWRIFTTGAWLLSLGLIGVRALH